MARHSVEEVQVQLTPNGALTDCRFYSAGPCQGMEAQICRVAVVAHPYATLGGSYDDPTVLLAVDTLLEAGYETVGTFNFHRPSWNLKPEIVDYASFVAFLFHYILRSRNLVPSKFELLISGYSYGSFVASQVPNGSSLLAQSLNDHILLEQARHIASQRPNAPTGAGSGLNDSTSVSVDTKYLLISPLLAPTTVMVAPFNRKEYFLGARQEEPDHRRSTLAVFGTEDAFTSSNRLQSWASESGVKARVVEGASHFWQSRDHRTRLQDAVLDWLRER